MSTEKPVVLMTEKMIGFMFPCANKSVLVCVFYRSVGRGGQVWAPEGSTAFKCLLSARFCAALLSNISDCDETFNYWEPVSSNDSFPVSLRLLHHSRLD